MTPLRLLRPAAAGLVVLLAAGCAEDVVAPPPSGAAFTLWGALDPSVSRQALRVVPVDATLEVSTPGPIDAAVSSVDLRTGARTAWADSLIAFADGTWGHVFVAPLPVAYNGRYRVEVVRGSDGATTRALVVVPPRVTAFLETDDTGSPDEAVLWPGAPQLNAVTVRLTLETGNCATVVHDVPFAQVAAAVAEPFEFGWRTAFSLTRLRAVLPEGLQRSAVIQVALRAEVASADWRFPTEVFDPELLIEPGAFTNVEGGFGFVGAAYPMALVWEPDPLALSRAGFQVRGFCVP